MSASRRSPESGRDAERAGKLHVDAAIRIADNPLRLRELAQSAAIGAQGEELVAVADSSPWDRRWS